MDWIKTILPLFGVIIGWLLSESGKIFSDKRQDKRKLRKLLFFLLELRFHFTKELTIELEMNKYIEILKNKLAARLGIDKNHPELNIDVNAWRPFWEQITSRNKTHDDKFEYLGENIDKILIELAEIYPILAYELSGQHNIKERLNKVDNYFTELQSAADKINFDVKQWINPRLTKNLLEDIDDSIKNIASQIDKQTLKISSEKINKMANDDDEKEMEIFIEEYLESVIKNI